MFEVQSMLFFSKHFHGLIQFQVCYWFYLLPLAISEGYDSAYQNCKFTHTKSVRVRVVTRTYKCVYNKQKERSGNVIILNSINI